ncbi:uncharacterized protein [Malus domestica]|uniref:uncharacterized protein n=1 Tax=Malus domestica TaxID=3750 RepID=UPI0039750F3C
MGVRNQRGPSVISRSSDSTQPLIDYDELGLSLGGSWVLKVWLDNNRLVNVLTRNPLFSYRFGSGLHVVPSFACLSDHLTRFSSFTPDTKTQKHQKWRKRSTGSVFCSTTSALPPPTLLLLSPAYRTPICKAKRSGLKDTHADDLLAPVLKVRRRTIIHIGQSSRQQALEDDTKKEVEDVFHITSKKTKKMKSPMRMSLRATTA